MRQPPKGYESTAVWAAFIAGDYTLGLVDEDNQWVEEACWERLWEAFRDGYSAGMAEEDR